MSEATLQTAPPERVVAQDSYTGLTVNCRRNDFAGVWEFYVTLSGADVVLVTRKFGGVDDDIRESIDPGFKARRAAASG